MKIGLLHFSGPPTIGGVEQTMYYQANELVRAGIEPVFIVGEGEAVVSGSELVLIPELFSRHHAVLAAKTELDSGQTGPHYDELLSTLLPALHSGVRNLDVLLVHNALTLHKNLALTQALWNLHHKDELPPMIGWHHDFAWLRPDYGSELFAGEPWKLLKEPWEGVINVVVSQAQQQKLAELFEFDRERISVIPPGVDPAITGNWTELTQQLVSELHLLEATAILLLPARITRRKNIELAIQIHAELCLQTKKDIRLIISGPPGPHNPSNVAYLEMLQSLAIKLGYQDKVHFLYQFGPSPPLFIDDRTMANLYGLSDALLFPSINEGFGIPILEAGLTRLPVFCSDLSPFKESGRNQIHSFRLSNPVAEIAGRIKTILFRDNAYILRERVRREFTWQRIVRDKLLPLLEGLVHD
jgi:glycosyltransferase involved in cell wall biosynthesis